MAARRRTARRSATGTDSSDARAVEHEERMGSGRPLSATLGPTFFRQTLAGAGANRKDISDNGLAKAGPATVERHVHVDVCP
jgi:hypothetical protein